LTKAITLMALGLILVASAAATSILFRDSVPAARADMVAPIVASPQANREVKQDKLKPAPVMVAAAEPATTESIAIAEPLRQAFAASSPADIAAARALPPVTVEAAPPAEAAKPKPVARPAPQKSYTLLSDVQIAGIKERLKLSSSQEYFWPAVETALRAVARKIHAKRQVDPSATGMPIDPDSQEVQQLKSAAMPLLFQLREDQKEEVRKLARIIGLDKVASAI
jgi:hypothetical protein